MAGPLIFKDEIYVFFFLYAQGLISQIPSRRSQVTVGKHVRV